MIPLKYDYFLMILLKIRTFLNNFIIKNIGMFRKAVDSLNKQKIMYLVY